MNKVEVLVLRVKSWLEKTFLDRLRIREHVCGKRDLSDIISGVNGGDATDVGFRMLYSGHYRYTVY